MKCFRCVCGNRVFFDSTQCVACGRRLGFAPDLRQIIALERPKGDHVGNHWVHPPTPSRVYRLCKNSIDYSVCNWLVTAAEKIPYCRSCRLNHLVPSLASTQNRAWWADMEGSKRRLLYTLLQLKLPIVSKLEEPKSGLGFEFLQDRRSNPLVDQDHVLTGHQSGMITVNLAEADHIHREFTREQLNEPYRTLLGHFRHESGHYYWERLLTGSRLLSEFRRLFGDERRNYAASLQRYHAIGPNNDWSAFYISAYAQAHPLEDWAETWAHYLHMVDTVETATAFGLVSCDSPNATFNQLIDDWLELTVVMNSLNRSMGLRDAYPFVLYDPIIEKLHFVHRVIHCAP